MEPWRQRMDSEDTEVVVRRMRRTKWRNRLAIGAVLLVVLCLVAGWILGTSRGCEKRFTAGFIDDGPPVQIDRSRWVVHPDSHTARVHILLTKKGAVILDGEMLGQMEFATVELRPGKHTIRAVINRMELQQMMTVHAGQEYRLTFDRKNRDVRLERVPARRPGHP
jgi:hypothetical protein